VETPRQMVLTGDFVSPSFNGEPRFNKPVLSYWVVAGFYKVFGVSVTSERIAIAFGALMIIGATFMIGRTLGGNDAGTLAALIVASAPRVMLWSRRILIDIYLTSFLSVALMAFVLARAHPEHRRRWLLLMYAALGLATLTKGPVALVLPGLILAIELVAARRLGDLRRLMLPIGLLIVVAIVAPWYVLDFQRHGWQHIHDFFVGENLKRYSDTYGLQHRGPLFYLPVLLTDLLPWSLFLPAAIWSVWRARDERLRLLLVWIAVFVGVFTFSKSKQDLYIFPIVPAVAALIACVLTAADDRGVSAGVRRWLRGGAIVTAIELVLVGGLAIWVSAISRSVPNLPQAAVVGAVLLAGGLVSALVAFRARLATLVVTLALTAVTANWLLVTTVMRPFEQFKPVPPISAWLVEHAPGAMVAHYKSVLPSMAYYLGRPFTEVLALDAMTKLVDEQSLMYVLMQPHEFEELRGATAATLCVIDRRTLPVFDAKLSEIVSGNLPQIWLVGVKDACR
ncbi:MAG: glycosyltransferase family 39 protein, partial [Acidobacteriota bacterium]